MKQGYGMFSLLFCFLLACLTFVFQSAHLQSIPAEFEHDYNYYYLII